MCVMRCIVPVQFTEAEGGMRQTAGLKYLPVEVEVPVGSRRGGRKWRGRFIATNRLEIRQIPRTAAPYGKQGDGGE